MMAKKRTEAGAKCLGNKIHFCVSFRCPLCPKEGTQPLPVFMMKLEGETENNKPPALENPLQSNADRSSEKQLVSTQNKRNRDHLKRCHSSTGKYPVSKDELNNVLELIPTMRRTAKSKVQGNEFKRQRDRGYYEKKVGEPRRTPSRQVCSCDLVSL